jgi:hypothetical protein
MLVRGAQIHASEYLFVHICRYVKCTIKILVNQRASYDVSYSHECLSMCVSMKEDCTRERMKHVHIDETKHDLPCEYKQHSEITGQIFSSRLNSSGTVVLITSKHMKDLRLCAVCENAVSLW